MPRTAIAVQEIPANSYVGAITFTAVDAANGMMFPNDGRTILIVKNADTASKTVTVVSVADQWGRTGDHSITVAAGGEAIVPPLPPAVWSQQSGADANNVYVNFSAATSTTIGCLRLPRT